VRSSERLCALLLWVETLQEPLANISRLRIHAPGPTPGPRPLKFSACQPITGAGPRRRHLLGTSGRHLMPFGWWPFCSPPLQLYDPIHGAAFRGDFGGTFVATLGAPSWQLWGPRRGELFLKAGSLRVKRPRAAHHDVSNGKPADAHSFYRRFCPRWHWSPTPRQRKHANDNAPVRRRT